MGHMKDLLITIYGGGDEAVEAACELAGIAKERLRLSANGDCPKPDNGAKQDILTDAERDAMAYFAEFHQSPREADATAAATLRGLLKRL